MADPTSAISGWAGGGASVTLGAIQTAYGVYQQDKNKRPEYKIPDEILQNLNQAQVMALEGLPAEQKQQYVNNLQQSSAYSLAQNSSRKGGLSNIAVLNQNQNAGYANLLAQDSAARMQNQKGLMQQRQTMADYKDQAFQINQQNPYYEKTAQNQALIGAGMQNMSQGFQQGNQGNVDWGKGRSASASQGKQFYTADSNSPEGMVNYGGAQSSAYNPNNGNWAYQGQQYDPGMV